MQALAYQRPARAGRRRRVQLALLPLLLCCGCGPKLTDIGIAVLISLPIAHLITVGVLAILHEIWRRVHPELRLEPYSHGLAVLALFALASTQAGRLGDWDLVGPALLVGGGATLLWTLLLWRLLLPSLRENAATIAPLVMSGVSAMMALSVATLAFGKESASLVVALWMYSSVFGWLPGIVVVLMIVLGYWRAQQHLQRLEREGLDQQRLRVASLE